MPSSGPVANVYALERAHFSGRASAIDATRARNIRRAFNILILVTARLRTLVHYVRCSFDGFLSGYDIVNASIGPDQLKRTMTNVFLSCVFRFGELLPKIPPIQCVAATIHENILYFLTERNC